MFSLLKRRADPSSLLNSKLYDENNFYRVFIRDLKQCRKIVIIESPYMTMPRVASLTPVLKKLVKRGVKVRINTRYPGHHDKLLQIQAWSSTKVLKNIGVKVWFYHDYHHRKIAVLDGKIVYEGSLNILSQCKSAEIMRRIESNQLSKQMIAFLGLKKRIW
jgi:phosphatidylserine/phosphatidylglycerophosphate/cardiolipin synthase-like enzyme